MPQHVAPVADQRSAWLGEELNGFGKSVGGPAIGDVPFDDVIAIVAAHVKDVAPCRRDWRQDPRFSVGNARLFRRVAFGVRDQSPRHLQNLFAALHQRIDIARRGGLVPRSREVKNAAVGQLGAKCRCIRMDEVQESLLSG